jgi:uncharacterized membrane protein YedE/YeeE
MDNQQEKPSQAEAKLSGPACGGCLLLQAATFGLIFGFLLQKGGVAKYEVLLGVLLLEDFTVIKVMGSAIVVGMIGVLTLHRLGRVKLHVKPTRYGANIIGGLIFGIGFGLAGYCPGTGAAALGQGNYDAIAVIVGMMAGSYLFAETSGWLGRTVNKWGDRGKLRLPDVAPCCGMTSRRGEERSRGNPVIPG